MPALNIGVGELHFLVSSGTLTTVLQQLSLTLTWTTRGL